MFSAWASLRRLLFFLSRYRAPRDLHSFPTRRSSDLLRQHVGDVRLDRFLGHVERRGDGDRKSTRLNSSHLVISYAVFCLKKKKIRGNQSERRVQATLSPSIRARRGPV